MRTPQHASAWPLLAFAGWLAGFSGCTGSDGAVAGIPISTGEGGSSNSGTDAGTGGGSDAGPPAPDASGTGGAAAGDTNTGAGGAATSHAGTGGSPPPSNGRMRHVFVITME